jgi:glycine cleavage system H protein
VNPSDLRYSKEHEWLRDAGDHAVVGITHHAQDALGDVVFVELPTVGTTLHAGKSFGVVESVKAASDLYAPCDGEVVEVNDRLTTEPELVNKEPYGDGWMVKVKVSGGTSDLLDAPSYDAFLETLH